MAKAAQVVLLENEYYLIKAPNGKVLEVKNFNTENGAAIRLWDYAGHPWQQWKFVDAGDGRWRIENRFTGKMIDLALGGVVEGTWLHQHAIVDRQRASLKYIFIHDKPGCSFRFPTARIKSTELCLVTRFLPT